MAEIVIDKIRKEFGDFVAVEDFSAIIKNGDFFTLLGPSGCGKTTMLRMLAGFIEPERGSISMEGKEIVNKEKGVFIPPEKRHIGMVFQSYAVWPHMTVFGNVSYPLKVERIPRKKLIERTDRILELTGLKSMTSRYPHQLSGGQQQRVALARALVMDPPVMLLDEPLSNLDAKLREKMRFEIKELQKRTGVTIIYVTHDQSEALAMSDQVLVMNQGQIQQIGSPREIYCNPANQFVADFIGLTNLIPCETKADSNNLSLKGFNLKLTEKPDHSGKMILSIRPEDIQLSKKPSGKEDLIGTITRVTYLGSLMDYQIDLNGHSIRVQTEDSNIYNGDRVFAHFDKEKIVLFPSGQMGE